MQTRPLLCTLFADIVQTIIHVCIRHTFFFIISGNFFYCALASPPWAKQLGPPIRQIYVTEHPVLNLPVNLKYLRPKLANLLNDFRLVYSVRAACIQRKAQSALCHVLAHRPPQEASDRLSPVCTKSAKSASGTLGAHFVLSRWYSNADLLQKLHT